MEDELASTEGSIVKRHGRREEEKNKWTLSDKLHRGDPSTGVCGVALLSAPKDPNSRSPIILPATVRE